MKKQDSLIKYTLMLFLSLIIIGIMFVGVFSEGVKKKDTYNA